MERSMEKGQEILEVRYTHQEIVRKYDLIASFYDIFGILAESKARRRAIEVASLRDGEKVLEVAFGTGLNFVEILKRNPKGWVDGIDVSKKMMEKTAKRVAKTGQKNCALHLGDCRRLPFADETFDVLMNQYLLDILPVEDFLPLLLEFKRVLKKGGRMVLVHMTKGEKWINQVYVGIYKLKPPLLAGCRGVLAKPFLEKAGLKDFQREFVSQFGFPSEVIKGFKR
ncbi:MAG: methyltransferase domain-containing protein [Deltaproteobacteria bacterium]|nr:MAG: methyltransferase domain-containing protein [Deltaproteobacteria bacterium]